MEQYTSPKEEKKHLSHLLEKQLGMLKISFVTGALIMCAVLVFFLGPLMLKEKEYMLIGAISLMTLLFFDVIAFQVIKRSYKQMQWVKQARKEKDKIVCFLEPLWDSSVIGGSIEDQKEVFESKSIVMRKGLGQSFFLMKGNKAVAMLTPEMKKCIETLTS